jgi:phage repressor protein C with HTH and peptisase S24 domain
MEQSVKQRLIIYLRNKKIGYNRFEASAGLSSGYISNLRHAPGSDKLTKILTAAPDLNRTWLLTGEGNMLNNTNEDEEQPTMELPLVPINAMAGALTGTDVSFTEYDCEKYIVPLFRGAEFLIRVQGDSMEPRYNPGDIVACKRVPLDRIFFQWGKAYVLDTRQGALLKRIEPSSTEGSITLESENPRYSPFQLATEDINAVALINGLIRAE